MNEKIDIRKLQLEILNREGMPVRTYNIVYDASEGPKHMLRIGSNIYSVTSDGELLTNENKPVINKKTYILQSMEVKQQMGVFLINKKCPKCQEGNMIFNGKSFTVGITHYDHVCNKCGYTETYIDERYPKIEYEPISPVLEIIPDPEKVIEKNPLMIREDKSKPSNNG